MDYNILTEYRNLLTAQQVIYFNAIPYTKKKGVIQCYSAQQDSPKRQQERNVLLPFETQLEVVPKAVFEAYFAKNYRHYVSQNKHTVLNREEDLLEQILETAKQIGTSDIHLECYEDQARIRLRLDGKLKTFFTIPIEKYSAMVNRIKIKSNLDIAERRLPQDGRIRIHEQQIDLRVSSMPSLHAEKIVLRLLGNSFENIALNQLGFSDGQLKEYQTILKSQQGIILISGPTGSGKTTTLYATLKAMNREEINILTVEDPIEYTLKGINQVQLNEAIGLTFPKVLRSFLRQDPDIIMIGEIRDEDTAQIAVRAALTGHLVLATIHTNSAWGIIARLEDMNIPTALIAETLQVGMAQRLVRLLCEHCKKKSTEPATLASYKVASHYQSTGCEKCHFTGYKGRTAIYELISFDENSRSLIRQKEFTMEDHSAIIKDRITLKDQAFALVKTGKTTLEEVFQILNF